jgi:cobalt-precorrin-5B (C1)-methyltransferase
LLTGRFPDPVSITLPKGEVPHFPLALAERGAGWARAGIVKDAGDDPDVTHGCTVIATVRPGGEGIRFRAGPGVGTITRAGLPLPPGEPAINPAPRAMMRQVISELGGPQDVEIEIAIPDGERLAAKTWNPRLGIVGGLSILGTTGIVNPYSCAAWIASIHRGVDVARAMGLSHVAGCTGSTSERAVQSLHQLPLEAMMDMGDFAGGLLKYLRDHPVSRVTIGGGPGKMAKLAHGDLDLHSARSQVDFGWLATLVPEQIGRSVVSANTTQEAIAISREAGVDLALQIAVAARDTMRSVLRDTPITCDAVVVGRDGAILAHAG